MHVGQKLLSNTIIPFYSFLKTKCHLEKSDGHEILQKFQSEFGQKSSCLYQIIDWNDKSLFIKYQSIFIVTIHLFLFLIIGILFLQSFFLLFIWTQALCDHYHSPPGLDFGGRISLNYFLLLDFLNTVYLFHSFINELFSLSVTFSKE